MSDIMTTWNCWQFTGEVTGTEDGIVRVAVDGGPEICFERSPTDDIPAVGDRLAVSASIVDAQRVTLSVTTQENIAKGLRVSIERI